ncbi:dimethylmenaquinone methyltransferase [Pseudomonas sp. B2M1-30]|uniref:Dimethylmenaquinone methyltransferase n=1 Tax=Pseudomonas koreensis TaxID=198620 RepID=A0A9X3B1K4_9PSED|nr:MULTISPECIES: dimethylmenaquinone methyltransferase [Pseudomonas]MCU0117576.1 dimethylmenaquinone methyltransferase [Pseudomonas sp. B2M1-30]MCU7247036.1 dimethylmenaquinone methyltransferase [Pseudomonas koreensis]MCU7259112.1 dimethylmenaquinone methyltransferase [Pseudomonas koreensis]
MSLPHDYQNISKVLGSSTLYEASGLPCAVDRQIRPVWKGAFIAAPAYPVQCSPGDNLGLHLAVASAPRGSVLVCDTADFVAGYWGEVLTVAAEAAGIVGLVINGGVRDIAALEAHGFPVFARGISVKGTVKATTPSVGKPFDFNGAVVSAGDLVVADEDGVIIIPGTAVERTLLEGQKRADKEAVFMNELREGRTTMELMGLAYPEEHA